MGEAVGTLVGTILGRFGATASICVLSGLDRFACTDATGAILAGMACLTGTEGRKKSVFVDATGTQADRKNNRQSNRATNPVFADKTAPYTFLSPENFTNNEDNSWPD